MNETARSVLSRKEEMVAARNACRGIGDDSLRPDVKTMTYSEKYSGLYSMGLGERGGP